MTLAELLTMALGDDFATARTGDATRFINQAIGLLHRGLRMPTNDARATVTTEAGTNAYTLPPDFVTLADDDAILYGSDVLEPLDISELDQTTAASGVPRNFALSEGLIVLYPNPDGAYDLTMRYQSVTLLTDDTDVPVLPEDQHPYLGWYARAKLYLLTDDADMHAQIMGTLPRELQMGHLALNQQRVPRRRQVAGTWSNLPASPTFHHPDGLW